MSAMTSLVFTSYQRRISFSVTKTELDDEVAGQVLGSASPRFSRHRRKQCRLVRTHDDPIVRTTNKIAPIGRTAFCGWS